MTYNEFELTDEQKDRVKHFNYHKAIAEYIGKYGKEPDDPDSFFTATDEELERAKQVAYAKEICTVCNPKENCIIAIYNATSTSSSVRLFTSGITSENCTMYVDGVEIEVPSNGTYTFSTTGEYTVKYKFNQQLTNTASMFSDCSDLTSLDVSSFDTSNVTDMGYMFSYCRGLTSLDVSNWNTSNVTDMSWMFRSCSNFTSLDLTSFNTFNVSTMGLMFFDCTSLASIDLSSFDTSNVTKMNSMFYTCGSSASPQKFEVTYDSTKGAKLTTLPTNNPSYITFVDVAA